MTFSVRFKGCICPYKRDVACLPALSKTNTYRHKKKLLTGDLNLPHSTRECIDIAVSYFGVFSPTSCFQTQDVGKISLPARLI